MMENSSQRLRMAATGLVVVSFILSLMIVVADVGISNTPYETTDSAGRRMGFNDPLSLEHYGIIFSHFRLENLLAPAYAYAWLLLAMHAVGGWLIWNTKRLGLRSVRWFLGLQGLLFPLGWLGMLWLPMTVGSILCGTFDREGIIDVPFIALTAQPLWVVTAMLILATTWIGRHAELSNRHRASEVP